MSKTMKACVLRTPGSAGSGKVEDMPIPEVGDGEVLIRVASSSLNPVDFYLASGKFPVEKLPKIIGADLAGTVETEGQTFKKGQRVYALNNTFYGNTEKGTWADYVAVKEEFLAPAPGKLSLSEAAGAVPLVALTAFQALENAQPKAGERVLIHAGAGGVGCWLVQLAKKHYKCHVAATAGPKNQTFLRESLGADEAVDYTAADLGKQFADAPFDVIIDPVGGETEEKSYGILAPNGRYSHIYNRDTNQERSKQMQSEWTDGRKYVMTICKPDANQLRQITKYLDEGSMFQEVANVYPLAQVADALEQVGQWHTRGKIVLKVS